MRLYISYLVFPVLMGFGIAFTYGWMYLGFQPMAAFTCASLLFLLLIFFLEKLIPHRQDWLLSDHQEMEDLGHTFIGTLLGAGIGKYLSFIVFTALGIKLMEYTGHDLWPHFLPFWLQVILVYLIADLGRYLQHRMMHRYSFLWRFHALHHSVSRLCTLKTSRSHIVERLFQPMCMFGLLFLLGASPEVLFWYIMPNSFLGMMDHSNLAIKLGPLSYLINGPAEHRLHHSIETQEGNSNFGSALVLWDMIFGTYCNPRPYDSPQIVGIVNDSMPSGFWKQLWAPFLQERI